MRSLAGVPVFSVGSRTYGWDDAVIAAGVRGEWATLRRGTERGLKAVAEAERAELDLDDDVEAAAESFRHERNLLAADDLSAWLERRELTLDDWLGHIRRNVASDRLAAGVRARKVPDDEVREPLYADLECGGELDRLARDLAARAAADAASPPGHVTRSQRRDPKTWTEIAAFLGIRAAECTRRAARLAALESRFRRYMERVTDPASVERAVQTHAGLWRLVRTRRCEVIGAGRANEIALLVREDGLDLETAARRAGVDTTDERRFVEDVDPGMRDLIVGAREGELLGPIPYGDRFVIIEVLERTEPTATNKAVAGRAKQRVGELALKREIDTRVRWVEHVTAGVSG